MKKSIITSAKNSLTQLLIRRKRS